MTTDLERLRALARWEAEFSKPDFTVGRWADTATDERGVMQMPWFEYSPAADAFRSDVVAHGWVVPFDWMAWAASPEGQRLIADPSLVAEAPAEDLQRLLTAIVRGDRFTEGNLAGAWESGMLLAIVRRAGVLAVTSQRADSTSGSP